MAIRMFAKSRDQLPQRVGEVLARAEAGEFRAAIKTAYKPNDTIPSIWIVVTSRYVMLCNTHRTRGVWRTFPVADSQRLQMHKTSIGQRYFELADLDGGRVFLPLSPTMSSSDIDEFMAEYQRGQAT